MTEQRQGGDLATLPSTAGKWALFESGGPTWRLLALGDSVYQGTSVGHSLDGPVHRFLRPIYDRVVSSGHEVEVEDVEIANRRWAVSAYPVKSPKTDRVVAVQLIHTAPGADKPARPPVGSWEWLVPSADPKEMQLFWNLTLARDIYEEENLVLEPGSATWRAPEWIGSRIVEPDRPRVKHLVDTYSALHDGSLGVEQHDIITHADSPRPGTKRIQMAGRSTLDPSTNIVWMRGVSHEVSSNPEPSVAELLVRRGLEFLTHDVPVAAIDRVFHERFSVSEAWLDMGLLGTSGSGTYDTIVHPEDRDVFHRTIDLAVESRDLIPASRLVRLATTDGQWAVGQLTAYFVDDAGRYAWVKFIPV